MMHNFFVLIGEAGVGSNIFTWQCASWRQLVSSMKIKAVFLSSAAEFPEFLHQVAAQKKGGLADNFIQLRFSIQFSTQELS